MVSLLVVLLLFIKVALPSSGSSVSSNQIRKKTLIHDFLQCRLCESVRLEGLVSDCKCDFNSVNEAVTSFFVPLLDEIVSTTFFRYFRVDLERPCPFWQEDGQCMMEGCSVCTCDEKEVPRSWLDESLFAATELQILQEQEQQQQAQLQQHQQQQQEQQQQQQHSASADSGSSSSSYQEQGMSGRRTSDFGWISSLTSEFGYSGRGHDDRLGRLNMSLSVDQLGSHRHGHGHGSGGNIDAKQPPWREGHLASEGAKPSYLQFLRETEDTSGMYVFLLD